MTPKRVKFASLSEMTVKPRKVDWQQESDVLQYIDLGGVNRLSGRIVETAAVNHRNAPSRAQQRVLSGDILLGTTRPLLKRVAMVPDNLNDQVASTGFCVVRPATPNLDASFLFHLMRHNRFFEYVELHQRGASYPAISDRDVMRYRIPVPPIEVQREIVEILDKFTQLEAELEAELKARRQQLQYLRELLLNRNPAAELRSLESLFDLRAGKFISASEIRSEADGSHRFRCYGGGGFRGYVASPSHSGKYVLIGRQGALCGNVKRTSGDFYATEHAVAGTPLEDVDLSWGFHVLTAMNLNQFASKSAQPGLAVSTLNRLQIPTPPYGEQVKIGRILDKFDTLVNDISIGLPAEIAARRKQYEYYRDQLLTFEEA